MSLSGGRERGRGALALTQKRRKVVKTAVKRRRWWWRKRESAGLYIIHMMHVIGIKVPVMSCDVVNGLQYTYT